MIGSKKTKKINLTTEDKIAKIRSLDIKQKKKLWLEAAELMDIFHNKDATRLTDREKLLVDVYLILINEGDYYE